MKKLIFLLIGLVYYFFIQVSILNVKQTYLSLGIFSFSVKSTIPQHIHLHISTDKYKLISLVCDKEKVIFNNQKRLWFEKGAGEESIILNLSQREASCYARVRNNGKDYTPIIKHKISYFDYIVLFIFLGYPLISLLLSLYIQLLDTLKRKITFIPVEKSIDVEMTNTSHIYKVSIFLILLLGITIRILYFQKYSVYQFQHDWTGHMEFIKYLIDQWELPLPSKGLQFPQQPLYYYVSAVLLRLSDIFHFDSIRILGTFAMVCSITFLYYGYKFFTLITKDRWIITIATLFISFTPSIIYLSARVNNDVLILALSAFALYYSIKSYQSDFNKYFYTALIGTSLLFMTKVSAAPIEFFLFILLTIHYFYTEHSNQIKKKLFVFSFIGLFLLGFTLLRVYLPIEDTFHFVNSSGSFRNQSIHSLDLLFFIQLKLEQLFSVEYISSYMKDTSLYTFINHQYRTMLIGEFNYQPYLNKINEFKIAIWLLFSFGLAHILGFISYLHYLWKTRGLDRILFFILLLNFILILNFVLTYPSICNTDFRYFIPSFLIIAYVLSQGLSHASYYKWIKYLFSSLIGVLTLSEIWFLSLVIL